MALSSLDEAPPMDLINGAYCIGYVNGFTAASPPAVALICAAGSDMGHLVRAYVRYMDLHPELLEEEKKLGLRLALQDAFPCPTPH